MAIHRNRIAGALVLLLTAGLVACNRPAATAHGVQFPPDTAIAAALAANFAKDPNTAQARELLGNLGGEKGRIDYQVREVVSRQGAFEAHYDVALQLGQPGTDSLQQLFGRMVPADEKQKLVAQDLPSYEQWFAAQAASLEKSDPAQAAALKQSIESLGRCYRGAKAGDNVTLMEGLVALVSPSRNGWYAEKQPAPAMVLRCLPV